MNIQDLKRLAEARLAYLTERKAEAERQGDVDTIIAMEAEMSETQATLASMQ